MSLAERVEGGWEFQAGLGRAEEAGRKGERTELQPRCWSELLGGGTTGLGTEQAGGGQEEKSRWRQRGGGRITLGMRDQEDKQLSEGQE